MESRSSLEFLRDFVLELDWGNRRLSVAQDKEKTKKNPIIGILLGIGYMIIGILGFLYPGLWLSRDRVLTSFLSLTSLLIGLAAVLYYSLRGGGDK